MAEKANTPQEHVPTLDEKINEALKNVDDKGKVLFGEDVDPLFKKAVIAEKKARDHQATFTKTQQELARIKAAKEALESQLSNSVSLSAEQVAELEELKLTDPDAWFNKKLDYERTAKATLEQKLRTLEDEAAEKAVKDLTVVQRQTALADFTSRTGIELTDDVMENDIPPRLQKKINEMPFNDYLEEVAKYLNKGKVVKPTDEGLGQTNIGKLAGHEAADSKKSSSYEIL